MGISLSFSATTRPVKLFQEEDVLNEAAAAQKNATRMRIIEDATTSTSSSRHNQLSQMRTSGRYRYSESNSPDGGRKCLPVGFVRSSLWTNFRFIVYCMVVAGVQGAMLPIFIFLPARAAELGAGPGAAAFLLTLFGAFDMVGGFFFGFVFDIRAVRRRRSYLYTAVAALFGAGTALLAAAGDYVVLAAATCVVAVVAGGARGHRVTTASELVEPSQVSLGIGLIIFAQGLGNFYGPVAGGQYRLSLCCVNQVQYIITD